MVIISVSSDQFHLLLPYPAAAFWGGGLHPLRCGQRRFIIITAATGLLPPETKKTSEETLQSSRCGKSHLGLQRTFCCGIINACFARHSFDVSSRLSLNDGAVFFFFLLICRWNRPVRIEPFRCFQIWGDSKMTVTLQFSGRIFNAKLQH